MKILNESSKLGEKILKLESFLIDNDINITLDTEGLVIEVMNGDSITRLQIKDRDVPNESVIDFPRNLSSQVITLIEPVNQNWMI